MDTGRREICWLSGTSYDWAKIDSAFGRCGDGTHQSPTARQRSGDLSNYRHPTFEDEGKSMTSDFINWGHGLAFTLYHLKGDFFALPKKKMMKRC